MLLEKLYQTSQVPAGTSVNTAKQLRNELFSRLQDKLSTRFHWFAIASKAVEAGYVAADRKIQRRLKLASLVGILSSYIGEEDPCQDFPENWETSNMVYGYGAYHHHPTIGCFNALENQSA